MKDTEIKERKIEIEEILNRVKNGKGFTLSELKNVVLFMEEMIETNINIIQDTFDCKVSDIEVRENNSILNTCYVKLKLDITI